MLAFIPGPVVLALVAAFALGVSLPLALAIGSVAACAAIGYALFYAPPVERDGELLG
ncbi:MAG: hypothetical protein ABEJ31_01440 [Haloarculaceae archaeon]